MSKTKEKRLEKKNKKWLEKYGILYTDCLPQKDKKGKRVKKVNHFKKFKFVFEGFKGKFVAFFLIGILVAVLGLAEPVLLQKIIDGLTVGEFDYILYFALGICGFTILIRILNHISSNLINYSYHDMSHKLRVEMSKRIANTKIQKFDTTSSGEMLNRIDMNGNNFSAGIVNIISTVPYILGAFMYVVYGVYINIWLGLILFAIGFLDFMIEKVYIEKIQGVQRRRGYHIRDKILSKYNELVKGIRDIKALKSKEHVSQGINQNSTELASHSKNLTGTHQIILTIKGVVKALLILAFLALGIIFIQDGVVTVGGMIVLLMYRSHIFGFFNELAELASAKNDIEINAERMAEVLSETDYPKEKFGKTTLKNPKGKIEFKNVYFGYSADKPVFENLNLEILPNECVGFVGGSGEGKSTIMNLITGFYDIQKGKILLDGKSINSLTEESLRNAISVVPQSPYIFNLSIKDNLKLANPNATDEEIEDACKKAYIHDFVETLPEKYNTVVGEGGVTLSGGQKQRLAIARAFLKESKILLLDEATSAVDNASQSKIFEIINKTRHDRTIIIVAHRLSTIKNCDKIFVVDNHQIAAVGTHKQLMKTSEVYKNLYLNEEKE